MFGLAFRFPAGRYHATPWGRNVNEADVAWPPEPWRILRALVACYWRKGDHDRWTEDDLAKLIDILAEDLPIFHLPESAIHAHARHYMPIRKGKSESKTLVFDAFLRLREGAEVMAIWPDTMLDGDLLALARNLASGMGYLGRAESWTECRVVTEVDSEPNCGPAKHGFVGQSLRVMVPRSPAEYRTERERLVDQETKRLQAQSTKTLTGRALQGKLDRSFRATSGVHTLPPRLLDALSIDTSDLQNRKWNRPPAADEAIYARSPAAAPGVIGLARHSRSRIRRNMSDDPTVARYLLAGHPLPRMEDAVKIGEVMRQAAMSKFGWATDDKSGKRFPKAPWQISGRDERNRPLQYPTHPHAFWLPEDADDDGWIDHVVVYIADGINATIRSRLDRVTRIWLTPRGGLARTGETPNAHEWRLALEGFGNRRDFVGSSPLLGRSRRWRSVTPFMASGHLKKGGYRGEVLRLLERRGIETVGVTITQLEEIAVGGTPRRALNFHRFRSRGQERQLDGSGALLEIKFPDEYHGPLALGYACHFGLGLFGVR
ncbi:type I-U CRISPR-associated protein Csb2 [Candidatus Palauibacter sp.]|uniref:type I-G CRISPR-associated protein Csb2 n=1 Tax=Candidatus Palauibacter sp. TaxID=3101350 RepID=UPI003B0197E8